ncbi:uncharacterized protein C2845_PM08G28480 [Panicum miliaceum]|uniref:BZIP domain-containing protein n=1 Tax=Panicum miliaceum TaxID=4540 RepID=A0A3L6R0S6_PANMI|nr:uncharacterized protein C2845_PM08G28480 [Panicum miliaceum]
MHTHTCLHTHTQVVASDEELRKPRKPLGNREVVRKYREEKKAHAAFLEEEVKKLRATNQQLLRRLQGHAALEAEVTLVINPDAEVAARVASSGGPTILDFEIDENGSISREIDIPEVVNSMDAAGSLLNSDSLVE